MTSGEQVEESMMQKGVGVGVGDVGGKYYGEKCYGGKCSGLP
jgi:hypothetical protein